MVQKFIFDMCNVKSSYIMKDRIKKIMEMQRTTQQDFADQLKIAPATLSSIFTGRTRPTLAIVEAIKSRFPQISTDWLMFGKGDMLLKNDGENENSDAQNVPKNDLLIDNDSSQKSEQQLMENLPVESGVLYNGRGVDNGRDVDGCNGRDAGGYGGKGCDVVGFAMKNNEMKQRRITEIRVFYDDQTWETFVPSAG